MSALTSAIPAADSGSLYSLAPSIGFVFAFRICMTFLWFQSDPRLATALTVLASFAMLALAAGHQVLSGDTCTSIGSPSVLRWIAAYLALSAASLSWTTAPSIIAAAGYWAATTADMLTAWLIVRRDTSGQQSMRLMLGFVVGSLAVAVIAWLTPVTSDLRLGNDDFLHPNALGFEFALAGLFAIHLVRKHLLPSWTLFALPITLLRTLSKASIAAFVCAVLVYLIRAASISRRTKMWIGISAFTVVACSWSLLEAYIDVYAQGNHVETLTGRTFIWAESLDIALESPWLGHGFYSYRWIVPPFGEFEPWHAHNELLQQFFAYGVVGVVVTIGLYFCLAQLIRKAQPSLEKELAIAVLIFALVRGLVDTERFDLSFPLWLMVTFSALLASRYRRELASRTPLLPTK